METKIKSYPCESVLVRKGLSKLLILYQGERSQDGAGMCHRDEAGQLYFGGCRVGPAAARVSALWMKRESLPLWDSRRDLYGYSLRLSRVLGDVTRRKWLVSLTGEVPLRLRIYAGQRRSIRYRPKRSSHAMVEEKSSLLASSSGMAADPEYLLTKGKEKPQKVRMESRSHGSS